MVKEVVNVGVLPARVPRRQDDMTFFDQKTARLTKMFYEHQKFESFRAKRGAPTTATVIVPGYLFQFFINKVFQDLRITRV